MKQLDGARWNKTADNGCARKAGSEWQRDAPHPLQRDRCIASSHSPAMQNHQIMNKREGERTKMNTIRNSPNIIQSDPETKTNASMSFSLSQRVPVQERLKTAASTAASRQQSGRLRRRREEEEGWGATIYLRRTTVGELGRGMDGWRVMMSGRLGETNPDSLLKHPSSSSFCCIFHLPLVGCCAMADTPAETRGFIGRTEDAIDAKVIRGDISILGAKGISHDFIQLSRSLWE